MVRDVGTGNDVLYANERFRRNDALANRLDTSYAKEV